MRSIPLAAGLRLARHYRQRLAALPPDESPADEAQRACSLQALREDWPQIEPWQRWAAEGAEPERLVLCMDFALGTLPGLVVLLPPAGQLLWTQQALVAARALQQTAAERALLYQAALLHKDLEQVDPLQTMAEQLAQQADAVGDMQALGRARLLQAHAADLRGRREDRERATVLYQASRAALEPLGPSVELVETWGGLVRMAFFGGQHALALQHALQQLAVAQALGRAYRIGAAHLSVSGAANFVEQRELALQHAEQALAAGQRNGALRLIAHARIALGHACKRLGRLDEAVAHYQQGISAPASALPPSNMTNAHQGLAETYLAQGQHALALQGFERALGLALAHSAVSPYRVCEAARAIVWLHLEGGRHAPAASALATYSQAALQQGAPPHLCAALLAAARLAHASGRLALAQALAPVLRQHAGTLRAESVAELQGLLQRLGHDEAPGPEAVHKLPPAAGKLDETLRQALRALQDGD